jgi:hypothetical protein
MKVFLISANTEQINMPVLPLGLAYVAVAAANQGRTVKMLNLMMQTDTQKDLSEIPGSYLPGQKSGSESGYIKNLTDITLPLPDAHLSTPSTLKEGLIKADDNLLIPKFYVAKGLEGWLRETVKAWMETRPHWVM